MSFIYAEKNIINQSRKILQNLNIYSDTKTKLIGAINAIWSEKERKAIEDYGFLKSIIIGPTCCISFAGNNTIYAQKLLKWIFEKRFVNYEEILEKAMQLHLQGDKDDIEFIICSSETDIPIISCIKNGELSRDVSSTWIGSPLAFNKLQELRMLQGKSIGLLQDTSIELFRRAIEECGDDTVGGFVIHSAYHEKEFYYPERVESNISKIQIVNQGKCIELFDTAENGGYTVHFRESKQDVIIDFEQIDTSIVYTSRYRYDYDIQNSNIAHLMIPFKFRTSTGLFI